MALALLLTVLGACAAPSLAFSPGGSLPSPRLSFAHSSALSSGVMGRPPVPSAVGATLSPGRNSLFRPNGRGRAAPMALRMAQDDMDDLAKKFEQEKQTRIEMDKIFSDASKDLENLANKEMETLKEETEGLLQQREEEWEALGNKAAEAMVGKVDSLAEDFLKKAGRSTDDDDDDFEEMERFLGPSEVAVVGEKTPLRDEVEARVRGYGGLEMSSCERLLETRGMVIEKSDTLVFVGDGDALDRYTVERLIKRCQKLRRVVIVSSLGVERSNLFPFSLQNALTGSLDKKRDVELGVIELSKKLGFAFSMLRVGKVGTDASLGGVQVAAGDQMSEDINVGVAADAVVQALMLQPAALNCSMSLVGVKAKEVTQDEWDDEFLRLEGPEVWREALTGGVSADACRDFVQQGWSKRWSKSGSGLTTPVRLEETKQGVRLVFVPPKSDFVSFKEEKAMEKARDKGEEYEKDGVSAKGPGKDQDGGIEVIVEDSPFPRVRARRCNMCEEIPVKEMSEQVIIGSLQKEIKAWTEKEER